jgi:serine phosphatase RsbU (regulator of sigma subunit)/protein-S-isoprenylcysteine O-methyltransferase Ste14
MNGEMWLAWVIYWIIAGFFVRRAKFHEGIFGRLGHVIPMYAGFFLMLHNRHYPILIGRLYDKTGVEAIGDTLTFGGLLFTVWARVHLGKYWSGVITLKEGHKLIRTGPYEFVRHPIYTGMIIAAAGTAMTSSTGDAIIGFVLLTGACVFKSRREEALLSTEFSDEYRQYKQEVPALVPYRIIGALAAFWREDSRDAAIESAAFGRAAVRSEQYRIVAILFILGFLVVEAVTRSLVHSRHRDYQRMGTFLTFFFAAAAYETIMLIIATRADRAGRPVRAWVWAVNAIVECSLPTIMLLGLTLDKSYMGPYRALVSSTVLLYCCFIILSTLRLSAMLCLLSGLVSSLGYVGLYLLTRRLYPGRDPSDVLPPEGFVFLPVGLMLAGVVAAVVARRIRRHVIGALAEAETRRKLDRVEYDLNVARSIQMGLLPKNAPSVNGYDIAGWSKPADQTGGDYYDWIELPDGKILFTVADASGHGIGPALLIAACRAYFRAISTRNDPLESITNQVDALISADVPAGRFITAAVALLDAKANRLSLYSAGHAPMFLYVSASDRIDAMDADQPPLGTLYGGNGAKARDIPLAEGDALILVTDGFFECRNAAGDLLGIGPLGESIRRNHGLAAKEMIQSVYQEVLAYSGGTPQEDDLTAVVIKKLSSRAAGST